MRNACTGGLAEPSPEIHRPVRRSYAQAAHYRGHAFKDIHVTHTSAGEAYYYSDWYLSEAQGKALAQWYGVEKGLNP